MRWDRPNAEAMMALAALDQSNLWMPYWNLQRSRAARGFDRPRGVRASSWPKGEPQARCKRAPVGKKTVVGERALGLPAPKRAGLDPAGAG